MLERLNEFIKNQGITVVELERKISASEGVIRKSIRNNTDIQAKWLVKLAENYPMLDMNWLLTGKGEMYRDTYSDPPPDQSKIIQLLEGKIEDQRRIIDLLEEKVKALQSNTSV